jgi:site-specific DNA recombinase
VKTYFAYTRVSTTRQGEFGVSLQQQKDAIEQFARRSNLSVIEWLEEQETAAKQGRPIFGRMLKRLRMRQAAGVIMHKIDRSARNLRDWAELGNLIDEGIEVYFANEALDLNSRGGRLSADIQAVVAADYIRNLREEARKGFYGRLKQGVYPLPAPIGYLNAGSGKVKTVDPMRGRMIDKAYNLYATGRYSLETLVEEMYRLGLRGHSGRRVGRNVLYRALTNPFYTGMILIKRTGEMFPGRHDVLVSRALFDRVQRVLSGKRVRGDSSHTFPFSRIVECKTCGRCLVGEVQKGHTYYRCHTHVCPSTSFREETIVGALREISHRLTLHPEEEPYLDLEVAAFEASSKSIIQKELATLSLQRKALADRQNRLTDAFLDGALEREEYERRKTALLVECRDVDARTLNVSTGKPESVTSIDKYVELVKTAPLLVNALFPHEIREWLDEAMSNRTASGKCLDFVLRNPLSEVANRRVVSGGGLDRSKSRTFWKKWLRSLPDNETDKRTHRLS